jgi:hypothetical protein
MVRPSFRPNGSGTLKLANALTAVIQHASYRGHRCVCVRVRVRVRERVRVRVCCTRLCCLFS